MPAQSKRPVVVIAAGTGVVLVMLLGLAAWRASSKPAVPLAELPHPVTVVEVKAGQYRAKRHHVGTIEAWTQANVGPQFVSAYLETVLVRPGSVVKKGEVIATLDCRTVHASNQATTMGAAALEARGKALASEAKRVQSMLDGGFVSENEVELKTAQSATEDAQLAAARARMTSSLLEVSDCILRAPFDGEVSARLLDPGAFVRPGNPVATVVDRHTLRLTAEVPESEFGAVAPGQKVTFHSLASNHDYTSEIARRSPQADPDTRTIHVEADLQDPDRELPVGSTAELTLEVGEPKSASILPPTAATLRGNQATLFEIDGSVAHQKTVAMLGEADGVVYLDPSLAAGTAVVKEGRALLKDGDRVQAAEASIK